MTDAEYAAQVDAVARALFEVDEDENDSFQTEHPEAEIGERPAWADEPQIHERFRARARCFLTHLSGTINLEGAA